MKWCKDTVSKCNPGLKTLGELWISFESLILNYPFKVWYTIEQPFWGKIQKLTSLFQRGKFCLWPSLSASWSILVLQQSSTSESNFINHERILQLNVVKISLTRVTLYHYTYFPFLRSLFFCWTTENSPPLIFIQDLRVYWWVWQAPLSKCLNLGKNFR